MRSYTDSRENFSVAPWGVIVVLFVFILSIIRAFDVTTQNELSQIQTQMEEVALSEAAHLKVYLENFSTHIHGVSIIISNTKELLSEETANIINEVENRSDIVKYYIYDTEGNYISTTGESGFLSFGITTQKLLNKEIEYSVSEIFTDKTNSYRSFAVSCRIETNGEVRGVLRAEFDTGELEKIIDAKCFNGNGFSHIYQRNGDFVIRSSRSNWQFQSNNTYDLLNGVEFDGELRDVDTIKKKIMSDEPVFLSYSVGGKNGRYSYTVPVGYADWYVTTIVPKSVMDIYVKKSNNNLIFLTVKITVGMLVLFLCVFIDSVRKKKELKKANTVLEMSDKRFRIAASHTACMVFEYDCRTEKVKVLSSYLEIDTSRIEKMLMHPEDCEDFVLEEDSEKYQKHCRRIKNGKETDSCDIRLKLYPDSSDYRWYKISVTNVYNGEYKPIYAIGTVEDINRPRMLELSLKEHIKRDILTGFYTRVEFERLCTSIITANKDEDTYCLALLDLDDFSEINDEYGYLMGDRILVAFSQSIRDLFLDALVLGKNGGDNFAVFAKFENPEEEMQKRIEALKKKLLLAIESEHIVASTSVSAGVAIIHGGETFEKLFKKSESALLSAKKTGKSKTVFNNTIFLRKEN